MTFTLLGIVTTFALLGVVTTFTLDDFRDAGHIVWFPLPGWSHDAGYLLAGERGSVDADALWVSG